MGTYREPNAHSGREGARNELALVKLDQQRCLPHATVSNQDCLQGPDKEASVEVQVMGDLGARHLARCAGSRKTRPAPELSHLVLPFAQRGISTPLSISLI